MVGCIIADVCIKPTSLEALMFEKRSKNADLGVKKALFPLTRPTLPVSIIRLCYLLISKMQNKKVKHQLSIKYLYFQKITGPTLLFSGETK